MARTKGSVQREKERERGRDSDNDRPTESRKVRPSKKGRKRHSPRPSMYVCYFCDKVNKQRTNHKRHMIMKHGCRLDGTKATEEDLTQARAWASKERADHSQQFKSKEYVSTSSDSDTSESSTSSRRSARSPHCHSRKADLSPSEQSSRSPSPAPVAPKVRKVRFELDEPLTECGEPSRARKKPAKPTPSTSKATGQVLALMEMNLPGPTPKKTAKAQCPQKPAATVRSEVHTAPKPPAIKKKGAKSSAVPEAHPEAATPKKRLVIETPHLEQMVDIAKKAVQNLKDRKGLPEPEVYRPTFGSVPKRPKVKGSSALAGKGKAPLTASTSAEGRSSTAATPTLAPIPETSVTTTADLSLEEAQNRANEVLGTERSITQLRVDLELSSDTTEDESKAKAKPVHRPKHSDIEPSDSDAEAPAQTPEMDQRQSAAPADVVPEILAEFHESIIISEEENRTEQTTLSASVSQAPLASTSTVSPVPSLMSVLPPVPLATDAYIPLRKSCRPSRPHTPLARLKTELSSPEPLPKVPETVQLVKRCTRKLSNLHLANATLNYRRSSQDIAEDFARTFQLNADEKHQTRRELAKMRLAQKALCLKLRSEFPVSCKSEHSRQTFLEKFDSTTQRVCSHMSDSDDCLDLSAE